MKALTLWQPWASLIADGYKRIETRPWPTTRREQIAIHAARKPAAEGIDAVEEQLRQRANGIPSTAVWDRLYQPFVLGSIVAVATVEGCYRMDAENIAETDPLERALGDHRPDRYGWILGDVQPLDRPIPCVGAQMLWNVPASVVGELAAQGVAI